MKPKVVLSRLLDSDKSTKLLVSTQVHVQVQVSNHLQSVLCFTDLVAPEDHSQLATNDSRLQPKKEINYAVGEVDRIVKSA